MFIEADGDIRRCSEIALVSRDTYEHAYHGVYYINSINRFSVTVVLERLEIILSIIDGSHCQRMSDNPVYVIASELLSQNYRRAPMSACE